ncbi:MAG: hypothetical protein WBK26_13020 [Burkholderiaceae bacterium]
MSEKVPGIYAEEVAMGLHLEGIRRGLENFQSHPRVTPDDAALLMCGINPARKSGITSSDKTAEADYVVLLALFQAEQDKNGGHKTLAEWLALAEKKRHKHHPIVREYLEFASNQAGYECLTTDAHASAPALVVDSASTETNSAPQSVPVGQPSSAAAASATEKTTVLKRSALIHKHRPRWPTVEDDLGEASRNGLKSAASVAHGMWRESKALAWAESRGKLKDGGNVTGMPSAWAGAVRVHTIED